MTERRYEAPTRSFKKYARFQSNNFTFVNFVPLHN